jgi:uncharacterized membrane protein YdbT with pleckstrin-like domain
MASNLDHEEELWHGGYSAKDMAGEWFIAAVLTIVAIVACVVLGAVMNVLSTPLWIAFAAAIAIIWLVLIARMIVRKLSIDYRLTSQRLVRKTGLLSRKTGRVEVIDIDDVSIEQNLMQRILGVGRIKVHSTDVTDPELVMLGIHNPSHVAGLIDVARRKERVRRGVHIESV